MAGLGVMAMGAIGACGGSGGGGGGNCTSPASCGGNVVGTWKVTSSCLTASGVSSSADCPQGTASIKNITAGGTVTYNSDMTYTAMRSLIADFDLTLPASCLTVQGITVTCAQLETAIASDPTSGFMSFSCASAGGGCDCSGKIGDDNLNETGTFTTAANVLTETAAGGQPDPSDYCVQGNTLLILPHMDMSMAMTGDLTISGSITLTKQ